MKNYIRRSLSLVKTCEIRPKKSTQNHIQNHVRNHLQNHVQTKVIKIKNIANKNM